MKQAQARALKEVKNQATGRKKFCLIACLNDKIKTK